MASSYATLLATARTTIAALTPTSDASTAFVSISGLLPLADEPDVRSRRFEVRGEGFPELQSQIGTSYYRRAQTFRVAVRYDSFSALDTLDQYVAEDAEQIIGTLEKPAFWSGVTGILRVLCTGGDLAPAANDGGDFFIRTFTFRVDFHHAIP
jgi:hypothetical protein